MSNETPSESHDEVMQRIVAYLDGELSAAENAEVEQQLASDPEFRAELQSAERAWLMLDQLPQTSVGDRFSQSTMELVVDRAQADLQEKTQAMPAQTRPGGGSSGKLAKWMPRPGSQWWPAVGLPAMGMAAVGMALLAFVVGRVIWQNPNRQLQANLPVLLHVETLSQAQGTDFLRQLKEQPFWPPAGLNVAEREAEVQQLAELSSLNARRDWLELSTPTQRTELRYQARRFAVLTEDERRRLRELYAATVESDLAPTMVEYGQWLASLPERQRYELRETKGVGEQLSMIEQWVVGDDRKSGLELTDAERREVVKAAREPFQELMRRVDRELHQQARREGARPQGARPQGTRPQGTRPQGTRPQGTRPQGVGGRPTRDRREVLRRMVREEAESGAGPMGKSYAAVLTALPPEKQEAFEALRLEARIGLVLRWLKHQASEADLEQFFVNDLPLEQREALLRLSPEEMQQRLRALYQDEMGFELPRGWGEPRDGRRRGPRGPEGRGPEGRGGPQRRGLERSGPSEQDFGPPRPGPGRRGRPGAPIEEGFGAEGFGPPRD